LLRTSIIRCRIASFRACSILLYRFGVRIGLLGFCRIVLFLLVVRVHLAISRVLSLLGRRIVLGFHFDLFIFLREMMFWFL
jgi:hypothetical protein